MVKFWKMTHQAFGPRCTRSVWRLQPAWAGTTPGPATSSPATKRSSTMQGDKKNPVLFTVNIASKLICIPHMYIQNFPSAETSSLSFICFNEFSGS